MNILYGFSNCSYHKYNELFRDSTVMILQQAQKYHSLMIRGLKENGGTVQCISGLPINRNFDKSLYIRGGNEVEDGVKFHYFGSINLPGFRQLILLFKAFFYTLCHKNVDVAICDILNVSILIGMLIACRLRRIPIVGIVTDVPGKLAEKETSIINRIDAFFMHRLDGYVLLTQYMNKIVNPYNKPYVVIEGQVDSSMNNIPNELYDKCDPNILMYAGSIKKIYGIKKLTEAFIAVNRPDWVLDVYGDGDFRDELIEICKRHKNVRYKGIKLNKDIISAEVGSSLLVNPRPTDEEYVMYSFPSKNMEYMVSGTPLLTTHLPGMPDEYLPYIFLFENETLVGMTRTLNKILSIDDDILHRKGCDAKKFVINNKNQQKQAAKVLDLLNIVVG